MHQVSRKGGRPKNEDRMGYSYTRRAGLFALADGLGGHPEGEVAAHLALKALSDAFQRLATPALADPAAFLQAAALSGHQLLRDYAARKGLPDTPRTTLIACVLQGDAAWWAHCGDSRLYLVRRGELVTRTRDHSYLELRRAMPAMPADEHLNRNVLFTCLGSPGEPVVDVYGPLRLQAGDRLFLCSDGLWGNLADEVITRHLADHPISRSVPGLVDMALHKGGRRCDNVTALCVEWESAEGGSDATAEAAAEAVAEGGFSAAVEPLAPALAART